MKKPRSIIIFVPGLTYTTGMERKVIEFDGDERKEEYIEKVFKKSHIYFEKTALGGKTEYVFVCDKATEDCIICALICNFYKFNEIMKAFSDVKEKDGAFYALIGSAIGLDADEDLKNVSSAVRKNEIKNVDGFYNFGIPHIKDGWKNLAKLTKKLYVQCHDREEVFALCIFILGIGDTFAETIVISPRKELYKELTDTSIAVVPFFGESDADLIVTLLSNHPSDVVVSDPSNVSETVLSVIRALAE